MFLYLGITSGNYSIQENLAINKLAYQSSTDFSGKSVLSAVKAVDSDVGLDIQNCSKTRPSDTEITWFTVDLEKNYKILNVSLLAYHDSSPGF